MRVQGRIFKDGKFRLAEAPILDAMTQGFGCFNVPANEPAPYCISAPKEN